MILYFSGTGNSEYVAKRIGKAIDDEVLNLFEKIKTSDFSELHSERPWVIVVPTYAWRIPRMVENWLKKTSLTGSRDMYFVMTCGDSIGNAANYQERLCSEIKMKNCGCIQVTMPENYIAMFTTPAKDEALKIIAQAEEVIDCAAGMIKNGENFPKSKASISGKISSGIVNDVFYPMLVHAKKFYVTNDCISCGKCVGVCPLDNVTMRDGKPEWGDNCTHCMACICRCPKEAIEYGRHSKGLPRYVCPKKV